MQKYNYIYIIIYSVFGFWYFNFYFPKIDSIEKRFF